MIVSFLKKWETKIILKVSKTSARKRSSKRGIVPVSTLIVDTAINLHSSSHSSFCAMRLPLLLVITIRVLNFAPRIQYPFNAPKTNYHTRAPSIEALSYLYSYRLRHIGFRRQQQWWKRETMVDPSTDGSCSAIIPASSALFQWHHPWSAFSGKFPFLYFSLPQNKPTPFARPILRCLLLPRQLLLRDLSSWQLPLPTRIQIATPKIQRLEKNHEI